MEGDHVFRYRYSALQNQEVESIRKKYLPKEVSKLDMLKELDRRAQRAGRVEGLSIGVIGCLVFGVGMCFGLGVLKGPDWVAVLLGVLGVSVMLPAYPVFRHKARKTKTELAPRILQLSDEIMRS